MPTVKHTVVDPVDGRPIGVRSVEVTLVPPTGATRVYSDGREVVSVGTVAFSADGLGRYSNTFTILLEANAALTPVGSKYSLRMVLAGDPVGTVRPPVEFVVPVGAGPYRLIDLLAVTPDTTAAVVPGVTPAGVYDPAVTYYFRQVVTYQGSAYVARGTTTGVTPGTNGDVWQLLVAKGDNGPGNVLSIGTVTTGPPGSNSSATVTGSSPAQVLNLGIPRGDVGATGPANSLSIGTVTTGAAGSSASASVTGTPPNQTLGLTIPRGDVGAPGNKGDTGNTGAPGPGNSLAVGTVTTGAAGSSAAATVTGSSPSQTLNLAIPRGDKGDKGDPGTGSVSSVDGDAGPYVTLASDGASGTATKRSLGTGATQAAAGNDTRIVGAAQKAQNLADLPDKAAARTNLGVPAQFSDLTGEVPASALPALAINDTFTVTDQAAMLALTAQRGDIAIRQDKIAAQQPAVYILGAEGASILANWIVLPVPVDAVLSVAGKTGAVSLVKGDVGLGNVDNTADSVKPVSALQQIALDTKAPALPEATTAPRTAALGTPANLLGYTNRYALTGAVTQPLPPVTDGAILTVAVTAGSTATLTLSADGTDKFGDGTSTTLPVAPGDYWVGRGQVVGGVGRWRRLSAPVYSEQDAHNDLRYQSRGAVVDAADYGLSATNSSSANLTALTAAVAAIPATGGRLVLRPGTYAVDPWTITGKHGLVIDAPGATLTCPTGAAVTVQGSRTAALTTITADVTAGADTITVASTAGLSVGDLIVIRSSGEVFDPERPTQYFKGEMAWVAAVSGTSVTLESRTYDSYSTSGFTVSVDKLVPVRDVVIRGLSATGGGAGQAQTGIQVLYFTNATIEQCSADAFERQGIAGRQGWGLRLVGNRVTRADESGLGYGVRATGCHHIRIESNVGRRNRHTTDVDWEQLPCREFDIVGNHAEDDSSAGISTHGGAAFGVVSGNHTRHCGGGIVIRSGFTLVSENHVRGTKTGGESGGQSYLHGISLGDDSPNTPGVGVVGRGLRLVDNTVDITHPAPGSTVIHGIYCTAALRDAQVRGNRLRGHTAHGMWFKGDTSTTTRITDNEIDCTGQVGTAGTTQVHGILVAPGNDTVSGNNQKDLKLTRNIVTGALYSAIRVVGNTDSGNRSDGVEVTDNTLRSYGLNGVDLTGGYFARGVIDRNLYDETAANRLVFTAANWTVPPDSPRDPQLLIAGENTIPRYAAAGSTIAHPGSGILWLTFFTAQKTETTTQVRVPNGNTAAGATPTLVRLGLYDVASTGALTLLAATANDTALFSATFQNYVRSLTASAAKVAGRRYALGLLVVSSAAMPTFYGLGGSAFELTQAPMLCSQLTGQSDLPASVSAASLATSAPGRVFLAAVLP